MGGNGKGRNGREIMTLGYAYVCGDILHAGHLLHLRNCARLCDKLIVGVLTDEAVMECKPRPLVPFDQRIDLVRELRCVAAAVPQLTYSPHSNIVSLGVDVLFESQDHDRRSYNDWHGRIIATPYYPLQSSSKLKEAMGGHG